MSRDVRFYAVGQSPAASHGTGAPVDDPAWPAGLQEAFWRYERALLGNDLDALDELFLDEPATLRADASGVLVGHAEISEFRRTRGTRGGLPGPRTVDRLHVQAHGPAFAVLVAEITRADGGRGLQTQVWVAVPDDSGPGPGGQSRWRVAAAHVSGSPPPAPGVEVSTAAVWRIRGEPLVAGADQGPLRGLTVAVKDLFAVAGHRAGAGNPAWLAEAAPAAEHAPAVAALLAAGADVTGLAQTDELAYSLSGTNVHYGTPPNPTAPGVIPGGSSSGPASAVALGLVDVGLGTDTGGSVRVPASYCGLFGIRPTHGAVSAAGVVPLAPSFDTVGWLTRDAATLARVGAVLLPPPTPRCQRRARCSSPTTSSPSRSPTPPPRSPAPSRRSPRPSTCRSGGCRRSRPAGCATGSSPSATARVSRRTRHTGRGWPPTPASSAPASPAGSPARRPSPTRS